MSETARARYKKPTSADIKKKISAAMKSADSTI